MSMYQNDGRNDTAHTIHRRRRRRSSVPSALVTRSIFSPRPPYPLRRLYCTQPHAPSDISSTLLTNQHSTFADVVGMSRHIDSIQLLGSSQCSIVSPHMGAVNTLDFDNTAEGRFLLAGGADGTVSVYDVGLDGSEYFLDGGIASIGTELSADGGAARGNVNRNRNRKQMETTRLKKMAQHKPLARSNREPPASSLQHQHDLTYVPSGHGGAVSTVQWYTTDTGAFVSTDRSGQVLIWDTNNFLPISSMRLPGSVRCAAMPRRHDTAAHTLLAVGIAKSVSGEDRSVRLCDLRSGSTSHELVGHGPRGGINAVTWSPVDEYRLCSGGDDSSIRLWDIRKSGSGACLSVLDREGTTGTNVGCTEEKGVSKKRRRTGTGRAAAAHVGPSDFAHVEARHVQSHGGPITSLSFTSDGATLVSTSLDRRITVWDVDLSNGQSMALPTSFLGPDLANPHPIDPNASRRVAATIVQPGSRGTATLWLSGPSCSLLAYGIHGPGGRPDKVLPGHLGDIRAITSQDNALRLYTGGADGMILAFGCPPIEGTEDGASDYFARIRQRRRKATAMSSSHFRAGILDNSDVDNW
mmetsp:Transcript_11290/g.23093  ORF Transcript_11290/g.23093 Transcript_11290/m.23093 type:complete len:581 (-) Transcript_11290:42-1784(-)